MQKRDEIAFIEENIWKEYFSVKNSSDNTFKYY